MIINKVLLVTCFALLLGLSGCSRQQSDWEKTRAANTTDAYELFLKKYPGGEFAAQAQARVKELYEERDWQKARDADTPEAYQAFLKQHPEGKWTEEARIRLENFTLAQPPTGPAAATPAAADAAGAPDSPAAGDAAAKSQVPPPPPSSPPEPSSAPQPTSPATVAKPAATASSKKASAGSYGIQLGAFKSSADAANKRWAHLEKDYPKLLAGLSPNVAPKKTAAGTLYRLQVAGLTEKHARAICKSLVAKSQACVLVPPAHH